MCGICGIVSYKAGEPVKEEEIKEMLNRIVHRGPDDWGIYCKIPHVGLGMRRLSIIDLVTGKQPIHNENETIQIVFNGEIYNFKELRENLEKKGHQFYTSSDTEVIVHLYEDYGIDCLESLRGMFSFALWDAGEKRLFLTRDRLGIKPLHYTIMGKKIIFASEIKSILSCFGVDKKIDFSALDRYLSFEYTPAPQTMFKTIKKLLPGHYLLFKEGEVVIKKYWDINFNEDINVNEEKILETLKESVSYRLVSDVPLGAFLSGGIDSSSVVALMSKVMNTPVKTFSIGFEDKSYNELNYARIIARRFNTEHHEFILKPDIPDLIKKLIGYLDEPLADFSCIPTYLVSQMARQYVTVALSGDGGDELFAGYESYAAEKMAGYYCRLPKIFRHGVIAPLLRRIPPSPQKRGWINYLRRFTAGENLPADLKHARWMIFLAEKDKKKLYTKNLQGELKKADTYRPWREYFRASSNFDSLSQQQYVDLKTYLAENILLKVDRMSMANSLEVRVPILDHKLVELVAGLPSSLRLKGFSSKYLFKKAMGEILPEEVINRPKQGFSIPVKNWFKEDLKDLLLEVLSEGEINKKGLFDYGYIRQLIEEHLKARENHSHILWALMIFNLWQNKYQAN